MCRPVFIPKLHFKLPDFQRGKNVNVSNAFLMYVKNHPLPSVEASDTANLIIFLFFNDNSLKKVTIFCKFFFDTNLLMFFTTSKSLCIKFLDRMYQIFGHYPLPPNKKNLCKSFFRTICKDFLIVNIVKIIRMRSRFPRR